MVKESCSRRLGMGRTLRRRTKRKREDHGVTAADEFGQNQIDPFSQLMKWMAENGFTGSCLRPAYFKGTGRGLKATVNIQPGDTLLCIPSQLLITATSVLQSELGPLIRRQRNPMTSHQMLTVYLLFEACKGVSSFWFPYIAVLPQMFGTPPFFNERELQLLPKDTCSHAKAQIETVSSAFEELSAFFELLRGTYPSMSSRLSFERFRWAWFAVNTRCVYMKQENQQGNCALAPYIDLLNHSPEAETEAGFDSSLDCYVVKTETGCKKWQQAFICYGPHGNDKLLLEYGFVVPKSRNSSLQFEIDDVICCMDDVLETESGILLRRKHQILEESNLLCNLSCGWDGLSWHLEIAIKILCMDSKEIENWKRVYSSEGVSSSCESKVKQLATRFLTTRLHEEQRVIQNILDTFPTAMGNKHLSMIHDLRQEKKNMLEFTLKRLIQEGNH